MNEKISNIILKYLDNKNFIIKENKDNVYFINSEDDTYSQIRLIKKTNHCYIYEDLFRDVDKYFPIEFLNINDEIRKYVESNLNVKVSKTSFTDKTWRVIVK